VADVARNLQGIIVSPWQSAGDADATASAHSIDFVPKGRE
jgi:hypothetical protein